jgi:predicted RNase H-like nuclease (RuvC/YqgF family)
LRIMIASEIEAIAKKYNLDDDQPKRTSRISVDIVTAKPSLSHDNLRIVELENEKLKKKYVEVIKEVERLKSKDFEGEKVSALNAEIQRLRKNLSEANESIEFYKKQLLFIIEDVENTSETTQEYLKYLKMRSGEECPGLNIISGLQDIIEKLNIEVKTLTEEGKSCEGLMERMRTEMEIIKKQKNDDICELEKQIAGLENSLEQAKNTIKVLTETNLQLNAHIKNILYETELVRTRKPRLNISHILP